MNFCSGSFLCFASAGTAGVPGSRLVLIVWTLAFFALMFVMAWRGYRRGPVRQVAPLCAFAVSATAAYFFGAAFGHAWLGALGVPWILRGVVGVVLLCLFVWLVVFGVLWRRGRGQVSETTGEPELPVLGALVGCWTGIFWGALATLCIAVAGTVGETYLVVHAGTRAEATWTGRACRGFAMVKNSVALYPNFAFLRTWSPLPESSVAVIGKALDVLGSPLAQQRLTRMPEVQSLLTDPVVYPVLSDPEIQAMVARRDVDALLADARVRRMLCDETFQRRISALDLEALLDYALTGTAAPRP